MTIALTMGFSRSHTFNLIKQLTASKFIRKVEGVKANKFYDLGDSTRYVMVPKVLIKHEGLTADEKLVWIALHNRSVLKITTKKELAAAVKMHPRTLTKVIAELIKVNVLRKASFSKWPLMNEPNSWRVIRDYHPVKHGAEWEKLGYEVRSTAPTVKKDCPTLELVDDDYLNVGQGV
jgi:DNA-binding IscR family transcriptional regulator